MYEVTNAEFDLMKTCSCGETLYQFSKDMWDRTNPAVAKKCPKWHSNSSHGYVFTYRKGVSVSV